MEITWQIFDTKYQTANGLITKVVYGCTAQLENDIDRKVGEINLTGDPSSPDFIAYENLTEEVLLQWVKASLGDTEVSTIETQVQDNVIARKTARENVVERNGLPWMRQ